MFVLITYFLICWHLFHQKKKKKNLLTSQIILSGKEKKKKSQPLFIPIVKVIYNIATWQGYQFPSRKENDMLAQLSFLKDMHEVTLHTWPVLIGKFIVSQFNLRLDLSNWREMKKKKKMHIILLLCTPQKNNYIVAFLEFSLKSKKSN